VGPIFGTATKATGYDAVGLELVRRAARRGYPVVAIGGITHDNAASVIDAGAASVAIIGALVAGDPVERVRELLRSLGSQP
jgi:thiamine-phosphate pyrophosphorylase